MARIAALVAGTALLGLALAPPTAAQEAPGGGVGDPRSRPELHGRLALSLDEALTMGLRNNLDVEVERYGPAIAYQDKRGAWGAYDPVAFADFGYESAEDPIASALQQSTSLIENTTSGAGGVRGLVPLLGAEYSLTLAGQRVSTNSSIAQLSPELRSSFIVETSIPLLRDLLWNQAWTRVQTSDLGYESSREDFRRSLMDIVQDIEEGYWNLVAATEQLRVAQKSLETARALKEQTDTQYEVGVVSRVEVVEAEAGVAEREVNLIRTENTFRAAQDRLIDLVLGPHLKAESTLSIQPTDAPEEYVAYEVDLGRAVERAFDKRPELAAARTEIELRRVEQRFARNQVLPELDLQLRYGTSGLSGDANQRRLDFSAGSNQDINDLIADINGELGSTIPLRDPQPPSVPVVPNDFGDTFDQYYANTTDTFEVRGVFSIPFPNTTARRQRTRAELELQRSRTRERRLEQSIILQVRDAVRNLRSAIEGIEAAERRREAAQEQLRAERIRLEHGESTPFDVLQRERDLVEAESQKIAALQLYRTSVAALDRAQGTILEARNVVIEDVAGLGGAGAAATHRW